MIFFYRENQWYAGQFMRKITCKTKIDRYASLYLEAALNTLSQKLLSGLVRDVDSCFLNSKLLLPVNNHGDIDFDWMSNYMKKLEFKSKQLILKEFIEEK